MVHKTSKWQEALIKSDPPPAIPALAMYKPEKYTSARRDENKLFITALSVTADPETLHVACRTGTG